MKLDKYIFSTFIAAAALALGSCSDFLDRSPQGQFTEDDNPNALVNGKIYNVYTMMRSSISPQALPPSLSTVSVPKTKKREVLPVTGRM